MKVYEIGVEVTRVVYIMVAAETEQEANEEAMTAASEPYSGITNVRVESINITEDV